MLKFVVPTNQKYVQNNWWNMENLLLGVHFVPSVTHLQILN